MALPAAFPFYGKTRYHYRTIDGAPPNNGAPPSAPAQTPGIFPPPACPAISPFSQYPIAPNPPFVGPPNPFPPGAPCFRMTATIPAFQNRVIVSTQGNGMPYYDSSPSPPLEIGGWRRNTMPVDMNNPSQNQPAPSNRVDGQLIKVADGSGYLAAEENTKFHVLCPGYDFRTMQSTVSPQENLHFKVQSCDSDATVQSLIRRLGGLEPPRLTQGVPLSWVGVEEWHELGNGKFAQGSCIRFTDEKALLTLREVGWGPHRGQAGLAKPVWIMLHPV